MTTTAKPPRQHGQHRWHRGIPAIHYVEMLWQREHPNVPLPDEIEHLGLRNYTPRHLRTEGRQVVQWNS